MEKEIEYEMEAGLILGFLRPGIVDIITNTSSSYTKT